MSLPHPDDLPRPRRDVAGIAAIVVAYAAFVAILLIVFNWHRSAVLANHAAMLDELRANRRYIAARDRLWADAIGLPLPAGNDGRIAADTP